MEYSPSGFKDWVDIEDKDELYQNFMSTVDQIITDNKTRLLNISRNLRMYEDNYEESALLNCRMLSLGNDLDGDEEESNGYNVVKVCVNTLTNKIGKNKVSPRVLTQGASYLVREKVKKADKFIKAAFDQLNVRKEAKKALFDACLHGTGFVKICNDGEEVKVERCMPDEVFVDIHDGYRGNPSRIYEVRYVSRSALKALVDGDRDKIAAIEVAESLPFQANEHLRVFSQTNEGNKDNIPVVEAWSKTANGCTGKHILSVSNCILFEEEWDKDYLPIIPIYYNEPTVGFYSTGIGHELKNLQRNIQETDNLIDASIHAMAAPKILLNATCGITPSQIDDVPGTILKVNGLNPNMPMETQIKHLTPSAISGEVYNYRAGKIRDAHDQCGVSQMSSGGYKPTGLDSGAALREYNDIQTERFVLLGQAWEGIHKDVAKVLFKEMGEFEDYEVRSARGSSIKAMMLSELNLDLDSFDVSVHPVSSLPQTPSARIQAVQELAQLGVIAQKDIPSLLDLPDLEEHTAISQAPKRAVDRFISRVLDNPNKPYTINRFMDLGYLLEQLILHYNYVLSEIDDESYDQHLAGTEEEEGSQDEGFQTELILDVLLDLITETDNILAEQMEQQQPTQPQPMGGLPPEGGLPPNGGMPPEGGLPPMA